MKYFLVIILIYILFPLGLQANSHKLQGQENLAGKRYMPFVSSVVQHDLITEPDNLHVVNLDLVNSKLFEKAADKQKEKPMKLTKDLDENNTYVIYTPVDINCILPITESLPKPDNIYLVYDPMLYSQLPPP